MTRLGSRAFPAAIRRGLFRAVYVTFALSVVACLDPGEPGNLVPKTVDEDPTLPRIEVAGTLLHAEAFGAEDAPMVMVLHGGPGSDYRSLLPLSALSDDGYRVVFWDQRGSGLSKRHAASSYSMDGYLEDLRLVIEHFTAVDDQPLVFIGHSWGAMYATWFINEHGDYGGRVHGAILSEPGAFTDEQLRSFMKRLNGSVEIFSERVNDATWASQFMSPADHARADYLGAELRFGGVPSEHLDPDNLAPFWRMGMVVGERLPELALDRGFDFTTHLDRFARPVLFLRGELNSAATLEQQRKLASSYPHATIETLRGVGHEMVWERPQEYLERTRAYFEAIHFSGHEP